MGDSIPSDTSSGRFQGQWSFLSHPSTQLNYGHARSLPPSSTYLRSDRSSVSHLPAISPCSHLNVSRSSLSRTHTASVGGHSHSAASSPSRPVLLLINSDVASRHLSPIRRVPRRRPIMNKNNVLPPISAYSFEGILGAISEDIEEDLNGIAEILGRSRLVLADQHESHLPPTGEIRAAPLQTVAEANSTDDQLPVDDVLILREDASLPEGSQSGSAAYGYLERLQARPRAPRLQSDVPVRPHLVAIEHRNSSPDILSEALESTVSPGASRVAESSRASLDLLQPFSGTQARSGTSTLRNNAVVSEVWLSTGADGRLLSDPPVISEAGRHFPLYSYDESQLFEAESESVPTPVPTFRDRIQRFMTMRDQQAVWARSRAVNGRTSGAESQLRQILGRQVIP